MPVRSSVPSDAWRRGRPGDRNKDVARNWTSMKPMQKLLDEAFAIGDATEAVILAHHCPDRVKEARRVVFRTVGNDEGAGKFPGAASTSPSLLDEPPSARSHCCTNDRGGSEAPRVMRCLAQRAQYAWNVAWSAPYDRPSSPQQPLAKNEASRDFEEINNWNFNYCDSEL